jgi:hypothetical protein
MSGKEDNRDDHDNRSHDFFAIAGAGFFFAGLSRAEK